VQSPVLTLKPRRIETGLQNNQKLRDQLSPTRFGQKNIAGFAANSAIAPEQKMRMAHPAAKSLQLTRPAGNGDLVQSRSGENIPLFPQTAHNRGSKNSGSTCLRLRCAPEIFYRVLALLRQEDTNSPQGHNASRARLIAYAPIRVLLHCSRRSQSPLLPLARQPLSKRPREPILSHRPQGT